MKANASTLLRRRVYLTRRLFSSSVYVKVNCISGLLRRMSVAFRHAEHEEHVTSICSVN